MGRRVRSRRNRVPRAARSRRGRRRRHSPRGGSSRREQRRSRRRPTGRARYRRPAAWSTRTARTGDRGSPAVPAADHDVVRGRCGRETWASPSPHRARRRRSATRRIAIRPGRFSRSKMAAFSVRLTRTCWSCDRGRGRSWGGQEPPPQPAPGQQVQLEPERAPNKDRRSCARADSRRSRAVDDRPRRSTSWVHLGVGKSRAGSVRRSWLNATIEASGVVQLVGDARDERRWPPSSGPGRARPGAGCARHTGRSTAAAPHRARSGGRPPLRGTSSRRAVPGCRV